MQPQFVGDSSDIRTILHFRIASEILGSFLPKGWLPRVETQGAAKGANLRVTSVIPLSGHDREGNPAPNIRYSIFSIPVQRPDSDATNELLLLTGVTNGGKGPYQTNVNASDAIVLDCRYHGPEMQMREHWTFEGDDGSAVSLKLEYQRGRVVPRTSEARVFSSVDPSFSRIYQYNEGEDIVWSSASPDDRLKEFSFTARGEALSRIFDTNEELISVVSLPWYNRRIFLPAS